MDSALAFGPVPSRRLGRSLGVNNIPAKVCSYSCVYCQVGRTTVLTVERRAFYEPEKVYEAVKAKLGEAASRGERVDFVTFVPDGEPTLDANLGREISLLKGLGKPVAVLTNASLLWREDVREDLAGADFVSVKVDAVEEGLWRRVNRPSRELSLEKVLEGVSVFAEEFKGTLVSETMLVGGVEYGEELQRLADFLGGLRRLAKAYVAVPVRPPAEKWVKPAGEEVVNAAYQLLSERLGPGRVELLTGYEGSDFAPTGNVREDLLAITAVHPMRRDAVEEFLKRAGAEWGVVEKLVRENLLVEIEYEGKLYYIRRISRLAGREH